MPLRMYFLWWYLVGNTKEIVNLLDELSTALVPCPISLKWHLKPIFIALLSREWLSSMELGLAIRGRIWFMYLKTHISYAEWVWLGSGQSCVLRSRKYNSRQGLLVLSTILFINVYMPLSFSHRMSLGGLWPSWCFWNQGKVTLRVAVPTWCRAEGMAGWGSGTHPTARCWQSLSLTHTVSQFPFCL